MKLFALIALLLAAPSFASETVVQQYYPTYSAYAAAVSPGATPNDICVITGSSTKTIRVTHVSISSTQTTAGINTWYLTKRSTADSAGTPVTMTAVPHDANFAAATAAVKNYTAAPTAGTAVGDIRAVHLYSAAPAGTGLVLQDFGLDQDLTSQPVVLRGTAQSLGINFKGAALPTGLSVNCGFEWTEN